MSLTIAKAETQPNRSIAIRGDGRHLEQSTRMSSGTFETPYGEMEWDKYFITNSTLKRRKDFVIIRTREVPALDETFARINRAATLGKRAIRRASVVLGARANPEVAVPEDREACGVQSSRDMAFSVEFPLAVSELAEVRELDVKEDGDGLFWLRLSNRYFDLDADNPAMEDRSTLAVSIPTVSPNAANPDLRHMRWQYADALLTPTTAELPGALGDISLRAALVGLRPGATAV